MVGVVRNSWATAPAISLTNSYSGVPGMIGLSGMREVGCVLIHLEILVMKSDSKLKKVLIFKSAWRSQGMRGLARTRVRCQGCDEDYREGLS